MATNTPFYDLAKPAVNSPVDEDLWGDELNNNMDKIDTALHTIATSGASGVPSGAISLYGGSTEPSGWLFCYGQAINRTTYSDLFTVIATTYGSGDGSTTFNLPDCRGRGLFGKDNMGGSSANRITTAGSAIDGNTLGATGGSQTVILTTNQMPAHTHSGTTDSNGAHTHGFALNYSSQDTASGTNVNTTSANIGTLPGATDSNGVHTHPFTTGSTGSDAAHNNMTPAIILNVIIKT